MKNCVSGQWNSLEPLLLEVLVRAFREYLVREGLKGALCAGPEPRAGAGFYAKARMKNARLGAALVREAPSRAGWLRPWSFVR